MPHTRSTLAASITVAALSATYITYTVLAESVEEIPVPPDRIDALLRTGLSTAGGICVVLFVARLIINALAQHQAHYDQGRLEAQTAVMNAIITAMGSQSVQRFQVARESITAEMSTRPMTGISALPEDNIQAFELGRRIGREFRDSD